MKINELDQEVAVQCYKLLICSEVGELDQVVASVTNLVNYIGCAPALNAQPEFSRRIFLAGSQIHNPYERVEVAQDESVIRITGIRTA